MELLRWTPSGLKGRAKILLSPKISDVIRIADMHIGPFYDTDHQRSEIFIHHRRLPRTRLRQAGSADPMIRRREGMTPNVDGASGATYARGTELPFHPEIRHDVLHDEK